jgi:hypothetical protein
MYGDVGYGAGSEEVWAALSAYFACIAFFVLVAIALQIWLFWRILTKAGLSGWLSLLSLIGGLGTFVILLVLALSEWPSLRGQTVQSYAPPGGGYPPAGPVSPGAYGEIEYTTPPPPPPA